MYSLGKFLVTVIFKVLFRIRVIGQENIPKDQAVIICSNHISNYDPPTVGITCPRQVNFMAKEELFEKNKLLGWVLRKVHAFPVKRGMRDRNALRTGLKLLKEGKVIGLFPEGTRSKDSVLKEGLAGAGFFAMRSEAKVIPCAIIGPYRKFKTLTVVYGKPIEFETMKVEKPSAQAVTDEIMENIQSLLDEYKN